MSQAVLVKPRVIKTREKPDLFGIPPDPLGSEQMRETQLSRPELSGFNILPAGQWRLVRRDPFY